MLGQLPSFLVVLLFQFIAVSAYNKISFTNVGFSGSFLNVKKISDPTNDKCTCELDTSRTYFSGTNAPLSEYLSVHFRGPLTLSKFGFYTSSSFVINNTRSSADWTRNAYYDSSSQTSQNVTFLTNAGEQSPCLGNALTYLASNGSGAAGSSQILEDNNLIASDKEYAIFSNISCPKSGEKEGCGVYRKDIPAFYGFGGVTKMFLFEFEMPTETQQNSTSFGYYDMPAIWLLDDHIPRTSQYPTNSNCSCWASGCGEFDIFEVMNSTQLNDLYSTFHTFQGTDDLHNGLQASGSIPRDTSGVMRGGVVFDSSGNTISFISNSTVFDESISASALNSLLANIANNDTFSTQLASVAAPSSTGTARSNGISAFEKRDGLWISVISIATAVVHMLLL
ncbi:hypothetical protein Kpol_2001p37 [Vanderwaltozyma polyspora DSM 70294]|uniref:glucan endo-1,3-beta-D-glucosidase n=1 Tax=Vanderwaltozyma polyspora (strain ATCC 22028 / DSM 70294 / BCRC 21397 / CBS 2163 / NBRC 10782 / NRRL Y-8283 / UCD 57-17) TaxID=436907 RepID=A7TGR9_VANPO|nr:uncharacterized protein Kpol_2001p37 [Vanderwaltozyma polyspora DSM 70294]EDO18532.1 hypothetical protein Kpol_2001p37 [Vanderwaltozyma polyspora DSM 70294]